MRIFRRGAFAVAAIVSLIATLGIQSPASADAATDSRLLSLTSSSLFARGAFGSPWKVGDCHLEFPSYVYIESGTTRVHVHAVSDTDFTKHADVWHSRLVFMDAQQRVVASVGSTGESVLDSPQMVPAEGDEGPSIVYEWDHVAVVPNGIPSRAVSVRWLSAC
ncbi:hypothetical protein [Nonomuraea guangzhouensis]|uniref:Secreted protein n=1 Tax=Nonomuraea guangzhouensis TaxID=1291555 RepID=A0ABW4G756_9ACTN|nr:hypothetical protein [Nonomuraea guangzhouensis]